MPGRSTAFNIRRLFTNLQLTHAEKGSRIIASLDSAKAFDSVEWPYLWETLKRFGLGPRFIAWVKLLYNAPKACVRVNGITSALFPLTRGTKQGCPLSPILFALAIEPLAILIRESQSIKGLTYQTITEKVSLFADDLLIYLADPDTSLSTLLQTVNQFGNFSGLKINWEKSVLYSLDNPNPPALTVDTPLKWVSSFKYLGITVHSRLDQYIPHNLNPIITSLTNDTENWAKLPLTLWGRVNIFKMIYLPKFLYIFHNAPVYLTAKVFKAINKILIPFLWGNKQPRIAWEKLTASYTDGGLALPNLQLYYMASQIYYLHWCFLPDPYNPNMTLQALTLGSIEGMNNFPYRHVNDFPKVPTTLSVPYRNWIAALKLYKRDPPLVSARLPIWGNSYLPHLRNLQEFILWPTQNFKYLGDLLINSTFPTYEHISLRCQPTKPQFYRYLQLRHAFNAQFATLSPEITSLDIEHILHKPEAPKLVSHIYSILLSTKPRPFETARTRWLTDIPQLTSEVWEEATDNCYNYLISTRDCLVQYKIMHQLYITPYRLHKMGRKPDPSCPRCNASPAGFFHRIWSCPDIARYWYKILKNRADNLDFPHVTSPSICLFGILEDIIPSSYARNRYRTLLFYARKNIAMHWMGARPPSIKTWTQLVNQAIPLIKLTSEARGTQAKFDLIWNPWIEAGLD
uniref:Reverse transcriptase domain-containing protein n=1 Tax=Xenopus tropicalis TaxID=8364 RepID=A0A803KDS8_XENTR